MSNKFQAEGRGLRESRHPLARILDFETDPELQKQIDELRILWRKQISNSREMFRTPVIAPSSNPCVEISLPTYYVTSVNGPNMGGHDDEPKCECGKDKHGFAFHMRFCKKWEPIC